MKKWRIYDDAFSHADYSTDFQKSKYITWVREGKSRLNFYSDRSLKCVSGKRGFNVGWLLEPMAINEEPYDWAQKNLRKFDLILTHEKSLIDSNEKYKFAPVGGCWIDAVDQGILEKSKNVSIIASSKNVTDAHRLRHDLIKRCSDGLDVYGRGYNEIDRKIEGLRDYRYSVTIENSKRDFYFTEKLIDCFVTGTVPIYYGCPTISRFFNINGMFIINGVEDYEKMKEYLSAEQYNKMMPYIDENYQLAKKYLIAEDYIYENYSELISQRSITNYQKMKNILKKVWSRITIAPPLDEKRPEVDEHETMVNKWRSDGGDEKMRLEYDLDSESLVLDLGGYEGSWASQIYERYGCFVYVFEPVKIYSDRIAERFAENPKVKVLNYGLGGESKTHEIFIQGDASSIYESAIDASGDTENITLVDAEEWITEHVKSDRRIDLMKINIEGGEYELLEKLISSELVIRVKNIQVQFHRLNAHSEERMQKIKTNLMKTHRPTYQYKFVWENWKLRG